MKRIQFFWIGLMSLVLLTALSTPPAGKTLEQEVPASQIVKTLMKTHDVGNLWYTITNWGAYGNWGNSNYPSAEWPSDSDIEYLFGGALWIGAIVNNDTIVATGVEGWTTSDETGSDYFEMFPGDAPGDTIAEDWSVSDQDFIAIYSDTVRAPYAPEHTPMGIEIHQNSYAWADTGYDDFIIFDYTVYNIDTFPLQDVYVGIYLDTDIGPNVGVRHEDDLTGFTDTLPTGDTVNIAWAKDDDGDGGLTPGIIGMKVLSDGGLQLAYNWWISHGDCDIDFGPWNPTNPNDSMLMEIQRTVCPSDTAPGTPMDDVSKYLLMSNGELDCDQEDCPPPFPLTPPAASDTRFLFSFGPFQLPFGDSIQFAFAVGVGAGIDSLAENLMNAQDMYDSNYTIDLPPLALSGLTIAGRSDTSVTLAWPVSHANDLEGYNLFRSETSGSYTTPINVGLIPDTTFEDADPTLVEGTRYYYVVTVMDTGGQESGYSNEVSTIFGTPWIPQNLMAAAGNGFVDLTWDPTPAPDFLGYSLYRSTTSGSLYVLIDSLGAGTNYSDFSVTNGVRYYYVVTAVDSLLLESEFSNEATALPMGLDSGILVVDATRNGTGIPGLPTDDQVDAFYDLMLTQAGVVSYDTIDNSSEINPPTLVDFAPYTTVIWHTDDIVIPSIPDLNTWREYLNAGGRLWLVGHRLLNQIWGQDRQFAEEYLHFTDLEIQDENDFIGATGLLSYPSLEIDSNKVIAPWEGKLPNISVFSTIAPAETLYLFNSASGDTLFQDEPTALCLGNSLKVAAFTFPLYPMKIDSITGEPLATMARLVLECLGEPSMGVEEGSKEGRAPLVFTLSQNTPNPFHQQTTVRYQLPSTSYVSLKVYNISGRLVKTLVEKEVKAGFYRTRWDGRDDTRQPVSSGIYFLRFSSGEFISTKKMLLIR